MEIKYRPLLEDIENTYHKVKFINLLTSSLGTFGQASESFFDMCKELEIEELHLNPRTPPLLTKNCINCSLFYSTSYFTDFILYY